MKILRKNEMSPFARRKIKFFFFFKVFYYCLSEKQNCICWQFFISESKLHYIQKIVVIM